MRLILLFLLLIPAAAAQEYLFRDYVISISPDYQGNAVEEVSFTVVDLKGNISAVEYAIAAPPSQVKVYDSEGELEAFMEDSNLVVPLRKKLHAGESQRLRFVFTLPDIVSSYRGDSILTLSYVPEVRVVNFTFMVKLPRGSVLVSEQRGTGEAVAAVYPTPERILTDGEHIIVRWRKWELSPGESFRIFVMYTTVGQKQRPGYVLLLAGLALGAVLTYAYFAYRKRGGDERRVLKLVLREDEQKIYDLLLEKGEILQEEVVRRTGFSKAKVSKLVRNLEEKGIIKKEPYRKTNRLILKKEFGGEG